MGTDVFVLAAAHLSSPTRLIPRVCRHFCSLHQQTDARNSRSDSRETRWMVRISARAFNEMESDGKLAWLVILEVRWMV